MTGKSLGFFKICWYLYCYTTINNWVEHEQVGINASIFKGMPTKIIKHCKDTVICGEIVFDPSDSSSLDHFNLLSVLFGIRTPNG